MMLEAKDQRVMWLDVLRMITIFAVVFLHVSATEVYSLTMDYAWYVSAVYDGMVRWVVPVFVMISGSLFLRPEKVVGIHDVLRKYIPRLLKVYIFWWIFYALLRIFICFIGSGNLSLKWESLAPQSHLWFLPMLAGVYLLIPFLRVVAADMRLLRFSLILWGCYMLLSFSLLPEIPQISQLFVMNKLVGFAGYFLLGYYLTKLNLNRKQANGVYALGIMGFMITVTGTLIANKYRLGGAF